MSHQAPAFSISTASRYSNASFVSGGDINERSVPSGFRAEEERDRDGKTTYRATPDQIWNGNLWGVTV